MPEKEPDEIVNIKEKLVSALVKQFLQNDRITIELSRTKTGFTLSVDGLTPESRQNPSGE